MPSKRLASNKLGTAAPQRGSAQGGTTTFERRSSTRPLLIDGWRKLITLNQKERAQPSAADFHCSVDVWTARIDSILKCESSRKLLTDEDWSSIGRLRSPISRHSTLSARILLRLCLSHAVNRRVAPQEWKFKKTAYGKPLLANPVALNFSVSHADKIAGVAVASHAKVGIDIEKVDQDVTDALVANFLHPGERTALQSLPHHQKTREFIRLWTQKEAYTKLVGLGHSIDFASISFVNNTCQDDRASESICPSRFESFYLSAEYTLYHTSLAIERLNARAIDVRTVNVVAPGESDDTSLVPVCN
jgi:phosphopantetheinyl transferase